MIMPRTVKDSDDEMEAKSGRRTRAALNPSGLDSPLRRSTRIKQPAQQDGSSPESVSDVSSTGTTRSTRRKTATTGDTTVTEATKNIRTRRNSVASDISELTETESLPDGPPKRVTRRSVAGAATVDTPPSLNGRTRRATRAGSESKSTPPVGRTTRKNRASSLEPEAIEEQTVREVGTPVKSRRRASALPSEPAVAEESEDSARGGRRAATKTVYELDEDEPDSQTHDTSKSWRRKSKNAANESAEKMQVCESPVRETEGNTIERSTRENTEAGADVSHVPQKLEDSMKGADSLETKQADDGCSQQFTSPSRGCSSYTIESLLSPSTEKQDKSPGNKENEILNDSAALLEKSNRSSNRLDVRLSSRNSLGSSYTKPQEKRLNVSVDDKLLSNDYETPTKSQQDDNTEIAKKSTPKLSRKERYSVDDCVVIIEPIEINRIDKIVVNTKTVNTPESPKIPKTFQVVDLMSERTENKDLERKLSEKAVENTEKFVGETNFEISNVVSIAETEKDEKYDEQEPMEVDESPEQLYLESKDTSDGNEERMPNETVNDEQVSVEPSNMKDTKPRTSISENKPASDVVNDEETSTEILICDPEPRVLNSGEKTSTSPSVLNDDLQLLNPEAKAPSDGGNEEKATSEGSVSNDEPRCLNLEEKAPSDCVNVEEACSEISVSNDEPRCLNPEEKAPSDCVNLEEASSETSVSNDEPRGLNFEEKTPSDGVNVEKSFSEASDSNDKPQVLNAEEKISSEAANDEPTSLEHLISNTESLAPNSEEKTPSDVVNDDKAEAAEASNPNIELTASDSSINNEKPINSDQVQVNVVYTKDRKRSIVTETPTSGANGEDATNVIEEEKRRKSASNGRASNASEEEQKKNDDTEEKSSEKETETEKKARQSDEESEYDGYPAFKDIPADEWKLTSGADTEKTKKNTDIETNSVHSVSTERNDSEFDFELVDKEYPQSLEKEEQAKSDYDSDDTVKIAVASQKSMEPEDDEEKYVNASVASEETPMDVSSDEEETDTTKTSTYISNENPSLDNCRKINEPKTPTNKNISLIADTSAKGSPIGLNSSRRKSLLSVDDQSTENSNSSIKLNSSVKRYSLKAISARSEDVEKSDNDEETDNTEVRTPKILNRKSLEGSAKKLKSPLDSSRTTVSAKNTPSNNVVEKKAGETSAKRNRSLSKPATSSQSDGADDSFDNTTGSEPTIEHNKSVDMSKHALQVALKKQLNAGSPAKNISDVFSSENNSPASPTLGKKRSSLNKSEKIGSAKQSPKDKNFKSKYEDSSSDSYGGEEDSQQDLSSPKIQQNDSKKFTSAKKSKINKNSVTKTNVDRPLSPEPEEKGIQIKNAKFGGAKKITLSSSEMDNNQAYRDSPASPDPEEEILEKSVKSGSAKKSAKKTFLKLGANDSDIEIDDDNSQELDKSAKFGSAKKSANRSRTPIISSDSVADDEDSQDNSNESSKSASVKKSVIDKNYSTIAQVNSDSDVDEDVESETTDDDADISLKIPLYLYDYSSESNSSLSPKSIDSDVERDMNLHGKSVLEYSDDDVPADDCMATESESSDDDDDGVDLIDFVIDDDEEEDDDFSDVEQDLGLHDDETNESFSSEEKKPRKRIIPRPAGDSDSDESEEEKPMNVSSTLNKSKTTKTAAKAEKLNKTQEILATEVKPVDLNVSAKNIAAKNKNLLMQSSTPKTVARQSLLLEKSKSAKMTTPLNKSAQSADSSLKIDVSKKLSQSVCEAIQTPAKLSSSFKLTKTPKTSLSVQEQLQTSLPADFNDLAGRTNLSKVKSTKLSTLNQTVIPPGSESPETRFLMKEKLNDSMPALKLQQRAKALRRSVLENLRDDIKTMNQLPEEIDEIVADERISLSKEEAPSEPEVCSEKKNKKKKKKKKQQQKDASENSDELATSLIESVTEVKQDSSTSNKKSKKLNKKKKAAAVSPEQEKTKHEEIPKKKKKRKLEEIIENVVLDEVDKKERKKKKKQVKEIVELVESNDAEKEKKKKRKERKLVEATEPEVPALRQKSRRIAARNDQDSGSVDDEPETMDFTVARDAALRDLRKVAESIKAGQEAKKKKRQEKIYSKQERREKTHPEVAGNLEKIKTSVKRLPDDVLENLSDVAERPRKKRKVIKEDAVAAPPKTSFSPFQAKSGNFQVDDGYIPLSSAGGTTQYAVVNLKKAVKHHSRKAVAASTFRERMLARNPRQPVSAYLMYQQKQKLSGKDKFY